MLKPINSVERKLEIINNAQELTINKNYSGTYRVYKFDNMYIYMCNSMVTM